MLSNKQVKHIRSLSQQKFRLQSGEFIAEGVKLADELIESSFEISWIYALGSWLKDHELSLIKKRISYQEIDDRDLKRISQLVTPNEVLLVVKIPDQITDPFPIKDMALFLDHIQDPGNLGTIIRTADWFGIATVVCSPGCAELYNPKVIQATMGSFTRVRVIYRELKDFFDSARDSATIYGAIPGGENLFDMPLKTPAVVIIGNESRGISEDILPYVHYKAGIPRWSGKAESLNAAIAAAIICSEFRRRLT